MSDLVQEVPRDEFFALVDERHAEVRAFTDWAERHETASWSMYLANRPDIREPREAASLYREAWWGVVVFTCFGSLTSTRALQHALPEPVARDTAEMIVASVEFSYPTVGNHRIQQGLLGAKKALVAACDQSDVLRGVLHRAGGFDDRYRGLRAARLERWGRTTCFDLLLRTGALGIGGHRYRPEMAYLAGSTGPRAGFRKVWGREVTDETAPWCEGLLQAWHRHSSEVVDRLSARWSGPPYAPGDLENALCVYHAGR